MEQSSTRRPILQCLRLNLSYSIRTPRRFVFSRPFGIVWTLYATTYAVANTVDTLATSSGSGHVSSIVLASTCLINIPLGVWKDLRFAQLFGIGKVPVAVGATSAAAAAHISQPRRLPSSATMVFLARDTLTLFGSFTLAPWLAASLPHDLTDLCNRPYRVPWRARMKQISHSLISTTAVRCVRILPAFGFGCLTNTALRDCLHDKRGNPGDGIDPNRAVLSQST